MATRSLRVYSIPFGASFLDAFAGALTDGPLREIVDLDADPLALASATLHVPTRRAGLALAGKLAERLGGRAALLPRIRPLGEADALELAALAGPGDGEAVAPAMGEMQRRLMLAQLVLGWSEAVDRATPKLDEHEAFAVTSGPAGALALAGDLARLIDALHIEAVPVEALTRLDAGDFQELWRISATFLAIAGEQWPALLAAHQRLDAADRHGRLVRAYAQRLSAQGSPHPVIALGSTGSIEATAELLTAIAALPNGAVVLPGLDRQLDASSWARLTGEEAVPSHPQSALRRLLDRLGIEPRDVDEIGVTPPKLIARSRLLTEAMRPAETTEAWGALAGSGTAETIAQGLDGIAILEAPDERLQALAIAVVLREAIEATDVVAALITPDRGLAERVAIELTRWGITADDSAGGTLSRSPAGRLTLLVAEIAGKGLEAATLTALLAHPLTHLGLERHVLQRGAAAIDIAVLRGRPVPASAQELKTALATVVQETPQHQPRPRARLREQDFAAAAQVIEALAAALQPLTARPSSLPQLAEAHRLALAAITRLPDGGAGLEGPDAAELAQLFADIAECQDEGPELPASAYAQALRGLMDERAVMSSSPGHRRVKIWGLLEARLLAADVVVLGSLVEGVWPARIATDPFLNRAMRTQLRLSPPERRIGQMAHDLVLACGARRCVLARPLKAKGADTIASRFLQRLQAVAGKAGWDEATGRGRFYIELAESLDAAGPLAPVPQPSPVPLPRLQPRQLSVTAVETLLRDPYAVYARHVLRLDPLDPAGFAFDARLQGSIWHDALALFVERHPLSLPPDAAAELLRIGRRLMAPYLDDPQVEGFVWPRFRRAAQWFADWERGRRPHIQRIMVETSSQIEISLADGEAFRLTARPDRIERGRDGRLSIVDFKTGTPPSQKDVASGFSPQLTLEAAILMQGGMSGMPRGDIAELCYVALSGARQPGREQSVKLKEGSAATIEELAAAHLAGLRDVLNDYRSGQRGFTSRPFPAHAPVFGDYGHLARVAEWSDEGEAEAEGE